MYFSHLRGSQSSQLRRLAPLGPSPRRAARVEQYSDFVKSSEAFRILRRLVQDTFVQRPPNPLEHMALLLRTELARKKGMVPRQRRVRENLSPGKGCVRVRGCYLLPLLTKRMVSDHPAQANQK